ncbi:MAG: hypothetical protein KDA60_10355 [Planctomycetales bacterium]|nr:hypothetical protein [Planctomycetales bacterium]
MPTSAAADRRIQDAQLALEHSPISAIRRLTVRRDQSQQLVISGRVATFYQKQQAQELVRHAVQDALVVNEVEVS